MLGNGQEGNSLVLSFHSPDAIQELPLRPEKSAFFSYHFPLPLSYPNLLLFPCGWVCVHLCVGGWGSLSLSLCSVQHAFRLPTRREAIPASATALVGALKKYRSYITCNGRVGKEERDIAVLNKLWVAPWEHFNCASPSGAQARELVTNSEMLLWKCSDIIPTIL